MDIDLLIAAVFKRNALWDKRLKSHSNRNVIQNLWKEISAEMGTEETVLRKKWKYLRDLQFSVEFGKIPKIRSGDPAANYTVKWPYFQSLLFLKDIVKVRLSGGNCTSMSECTQVEQSQSNETDIEVSNKDTDLDVQNDDSISVITSDNAEKIVDVENNKQSSQGINKYTNAIKRKRITQSWNEEMIKIEQQKLQYLQEKSKKRRVADEEDDHSSFFKSLLPHVRKIPPNRILSFRGRIQQIVDEYAYYGASSSTFVPSPQISPCSGSDVYSSSSLYSASIPQTFTHSTYNTTTQNTNTLEEPESPHYMLNM